MHCKLHRAYLLKAVKQSTQLPDRNRLMLHIIYRYIKCVRLQLYTAYYVSFCWTNTVRVASSRAGFLPAETYFCHTCGLTSMSYVHLLASGVDASKHEHVVN